MTDVRTAQASRASIRKRTVRHSLAIYLGTSGAARKVRPRRLLDAFRDGSGSWAVWMGPVGIAYTRTEPWVRPSEAEASHGTGNDAEDVFAVFERVGRRIAALEAAALSRT